MNKQIAVLIAVLALLSPAEDAAFAHPASGIVVDQQGQIFFIYSRHGVCKLNAQGELSYIHRTGGGHWLCLDPKGSFSHTQPKYFERISPEGARPALIFADGGSPIAVLPDGGLYYVSGVEELTPGGLQVARNSPGGAISALATSLTKVTEKPLTGLASAPNGELYVACPSAVFKMTRDGAFSTLVDPIRLDGCDVDYPDNNTNNALPYLRGLAVDKHGTVFAAATACHCLVKITPDGKVEPILKADRPWSPTGVTEQDGDVYVLEYTHATEPKEEGWLPRVRKIARNGAVTTLVTISSATNIPAEK
jgi:sugar lactone lactonase YvrE